MPTIEEMLKIAKDAGASDVHITVGVPPKMRVNGKLITMDFERLLPADTKLLLDEIMTEQQKERFEESGEYDMSFSIIGQGRYRANAYKQRGSVALALRLVGTQVPSAESLGLYPLRDRIFLLCLPQSYDQHFISIPSKLFRQHADNSLSPALSHAVNMKQQFFSVSHPLNSS